MTVLAHSYLLIEMIVWEEALAQMCMLRIDLLHWMSL